MLSIHAQSPAGAIPRRSPSPPPTIRRALGGLLLVLLSACSASETQPLVDNTPTGPNGPPPSSLRDTARLELRGFGVDVGTYDETTGLAGDFDLHLAPLSPLGPVGFVGRPVVDVQGETKYLNELDFFVRPGTRVVSPIDGVVAWVQYQPQSQDYEVLLRPSARSIWAVSIDHIKNVVVGSGQVIRAGQQLGEVITFRRSDHPSEPPVGFVELMVINEATDTAWCPTELLHPAKRDSLDGALRGLIRSWRRLGHNEPDTTAMVRTGCWRLNGRAF